MRNLWQSAGVTDIKGFNNPIDKIKKVILEDMYESEMDTHMQYEKNKNRPEETTTAVIPSKLRIGCWN